MKKILLIIGILLPILLHSQQKRSIIVTYIKAYKNYKDKSDKAPRLMKNLEYKLWANPDEAVFKYLPAMDIDGERVNEKFIGRSGGRGVYYKNLKKRIKLHQTTSVDKEFLIDVGFNQYNWKIDKTQTKIVLGYTCYKATAIFEEYSRMNRKTKTFHYEVWFTPKIPMPFGPSGYDGLPGLVLEAHQGSFYFIAQKIKFVKNNSINVPGKGKKVTYNEFQKIAFRLFCEKLNITEEAYYELIDKRKKSKQKN